MEMHHLLITTKSGFLVDPEDRDKMIDKIARLISDTDLRKKMGDNGRMMIEKDHSSKK